MFSKLHARTKSQSSNNNHLADAKDPYGDANDFDMTSLTPPNADKKRASVLSKISGKALLGTPESPKLYAEKDGSLPHEMVPVLTLLGSHSSRIYMEGYFMVLPELNSEGQPVPDRKWSEVFATLQGTILTMWDTGMLEQGKHETNFINIADSYMRSVENLNADLKDVIILSSTMKNRYLLQFASKKLYNEWTAALRLAAFERTSLQEAYTGALLSSKGSQLHGIRALLAETRVKSESWCEVRFGVGMPWKRVWAVVTPNVALKEKKERKKRGNIGKIELFNDPKDQKKKRPLATVHQAFNAFAVFPEKAVLVNVSSLVKMECLVEFDGDTELRESALFIMPEQRAGIQGYETLIRFLIPIFDVFNLYGRPKRLNADKNDINSLLFGMPTLPRSYYLDTIDVYMLAALPDSASWSTNEWSNKIKELIARKMAMGFHGTGSIHSEPRSSPTSMSNSPSQASSLKVPNGRSLGNERQRAVSDPHGVPKIFSSNINGSQSSLEDGTTSSNKFAPAVSSPLQHSRPAPKAPTKPLSATALVAGAAAGATTASSTGSAPAVSAQSVSGPSDSVSTSSLLTSSAPGNAETAGSGTVIGMIPSGGSPVPNVRTNGDFQPDFAAMHAPSSASNGTVSTTTSTSTLRMPEAAPKGPRVQPFPSGPPNGGSHHQRVKSEGQPAQRGLLSPHLNDMPFETLGGNPESQRDSKLTAASNDSFVSATENPANATDFNRNNLFDPSYRPSHQSYADYSEYMRQYLQNLSIKTADAGNDTDNFAMDVASSGVSGPYTGRNESSPVKQGPVPNSQGARNGPPRGGLISAMESDDSDDDDDVVDSQPMTPRGQAVGRAQLLNTPMRTPEVSRPAVGPDTQASSALPEISQLQPTALSGPKQGPYPFAPGSPQARSIAKESSGNANNGLSSEPDRPSGPRPQPVSPRANRKPVPVATSLDPWQNSGSSIGGAQTSPPRKPIAQAPDRVPAPQRVPAPEQPVHGAQPQTGPMPPVQTPQAQGQQFQQNHYAQPQYPPPQMQSRNPFSPAGSPNLGSQQTFPDRPMHSPQQFSAPPGNSNNPFGPAGPSGSNPMLAQPGFPGTQWGMPPSRYNVAPQGGQRSGYSGVAPGGAMGYPGPQPRPGPQPHPEQFGLRTQPKQYMNYGQLPMMHANTSGPMNHPTGMNGTMAGQGAQMPPPNQQQSSAKTGPVIRPLNEIRAQQLRSARAQAMNGNI